MLATYCTLIKARTKADPGGSKRPQYRLRAPIKEDVADIDGGLTKAKHGDKLPSPSCIKRVSSSIRVREQENYIIEYMQC